MGQKSSVVKVTCKVSVPSDCGTLDAIRVSYKKASCCGTKRRVVASFTFPRKNWRQLFPEDLLRNKSAKVAAVNIGKLMKKDGTTAVKVDCLAAGVSVFTTQITLANLRAMLQYKQVGGEVLLSFGLRGRRLEGAGAEGHAFTALLMNGKWFGDGSANHRLEPPQLRQTANTSEEEETPFQGEYSPEAEKKAKEWEELVEKAAKEWEEFVAKTYNGVWEDEISPDMDPPHQNVNAQKASEDNSSPAKDEETPGGDDPARGSLWDVVADCAAVVALVLSAYNVWLEYNEY